jgi:V8-like Glu-specific endopeptidase
VMNERAARQQSQPTQRRRSATPEQSVASPTLTIPNSTVQFPVRINKSTNKRDVCRLNAGTALDPRYTFPATTNVKIYMCWGSSCSACSGTMLGDHLVLTAGHCVYDTSTNQWASTVIAVAGQGDSVFPSLSADVQSSSSTSPKVNQAQIAALDWPYGFAWGATMKSFNGYTTSGGDPCTTFSNWDMAVIELDRRLGSRTGYLGWSSTSTTSSNIRGYPGTSCWGVYCYSRFFSTSQWTTEQFHVSGFVEGGDSGGCAYNYVSGPPAQRLVQGVVSCGSTDGNTASIAPAPFC